jgi:hypothetical protein
MMRFDPNALLSLMWHSDVDCERRDDGFRYVRGVLSGNTTSQAFNLRCLAEKAVRRGAGVVIFEHCTDTKPLWMFSFGEAVLLAESSWQQRQGSPICVAEPDGKVMVGMPSEHYLPRVTHNVIAEFLTASYGLRSPKIVLAAITDRFNNIKPPLALVPNLDRIPPSFSDFSWDDELIRISWYFLPTVGIMRPPRDATLFRAWFSRIPSLI